MRGQMKRNLGLTSWTMFLLGAFVLGSCVEDEIIENKHNLTSSETISFDAVVEWPKDYTDSRSATSSLKRKGKLMLQSEDDCEPVPMGIYVQDGIYPAGKEEATSRGAVITKNELQSFDVWATLNKAQSAGGGSIEYIAGQEFTNTDGVFSSTGTRYYWPGEGPTIDFLAVGNANNAFVPNMSGASGTFKYTVPEAATAQNDIVVAKAVSIPGNNDASVPLDFQHIMSAVNVKVGKEMTAGTINSITFTNIKSQGTYDVASGTWTNVGTTDDYTVTFADGSNVVTESTAEGTLINGTDATFMMIPQALTDIETEKVEIIVNFTYATTGNEKNLKASLSGQEWAQGITTNYYINVSPDFVLDIVTESEDIPISDCHYDTKIIEISDAQNVGWVLTSNAPAWVKFRAIPSDFETNADYINFREYWIETHTVQEIDITLNSSGQPEDDPYYHTPRIYDISSTLAGSGNTRVMVYFYENVGEDPEDKDIRTAKISLAKDANSNEADYIEVNQFYPLWKNGIAFERIEENSNKFPWGFNSDLKIRYTYPSIESNITTGLGSVVDWFVNLIIELIRSYNRLRAYDNFTTNYPASAYPNGFLTMGGSRRTQWTVTLDYSKLSDLGTIGTEESGLTNTIDLVEFVGGTGNTSITNVENWLKNNMNNTILSGSNEHTSIASTAVFQATKKNKRELYTEITNTTSTQNGQTRTEQEIDNRIIYTEDQGIVWFLPTKEELTNLVTTAHDGIDDSGDMPLSGTYWTSSAVSSNNTEAYYYSLSTNADGEQTASSAPKSRTETHKIRAARMKPTN